MRKIVAILAVISLGLTACGQIKVGGLFKGNGASAANASASANVAAKPLDTTAIQTQTLAPAAAGSASTNASASANSAGRVIGRAAAAPPLAKPAQSPQNAAEIGAAATAALGASATASTAATTAAPAAATTAAPAPKAALAAPKSPEEAACVKGGGRWGKAGNTGAEACFHPSKDAGKSCKKESDCSSQCLARSRSCAPFWPIFGCTEVVQDDGAVVKLCLQ